MERCAQHIERAQQIDIDHRLERVGRDAQRRGDEIAGRPSQDDVDLTISIAGRRKGLIHGVEITHIGGEPHRFRPLVDLYYEAGRRAGHPREHLKVGVHALGYVADTDQQASDDFFPGYAEAFTKIGQERGWPPVTRGQFEALRRPKGALLVSDPETVASKLLQTNEDLGGISRISFQMSVAALAHDKLIHAIELLGARVAPIIRKALPQLQPSI